MNQEEQLEAIIAIGFEAKKFIESDLGQYIRGCAIQEIDELTEKLKHPDTPLAAVDLLRMQIKCREKAVEWLAEAIQNADNAYSQLEIANAED